MNSLPEMLELIPLVTLITERNASRSRPEILHSNIMTINIVMS